MSLAHTEAVDRTDLPADVEAPTPSPEGDEDRVSILIVDDRVDKLLTLQAVLEELDQNIVVAQSGSDALKRMLSTTSRSFSSTSTCPGWTA